MSNLSRQALRRKTLNYYKRLMWVGKDWPDGGLETVRRRAKPQFFKAGESDDVELATKQYKKLDFILKEMEHYASFHKYRTLRKRYYDKEEIAAMEKSFKDAIDKQTK
mmetsp:Transcript_7887/g.13724  ORF Transcript_7887/g.13724 Transcript_7887/m.13724 type:complete len:108 (+) Transcript_7887:111-434(+)